VEHWLFGWRISQRRLVRLLAGGTSAAGMIQSSTLLGPEGPDALGPPLDWTDISSNGLGRALFTLVIQRVREPGYATV
jgi:hypothetical protein